MPNNEVKLLPPGDPERYWDGFAKRYLPDVYKRKNLSLSPENLEHLFAQILRTLGLNESDFLE